MQDRKTYLKTILAISGIAFLLAVVLTVHALSGAGLIGCGAGSSCDLVTRSKWSLLFGVIPVSALGAALHAAVLVCAGLLLRKPARALNILLCLLAHAAFVVAVWMVILQGFFIHAFCPFCMTEHILGGVLLAIVILYLLRLGTEGRLALIDGSRAGAGLAALFIAVQLLTTPSVRSQQGRGEQLLPVPDPVASPSVGPVDAARRIALLYDYQCPHCRVIHGMLEEVAAHYGGEVVFVLCPTPLSQQCNPYLPGGEDRFEGSCALARQALGLWNIDPALFADFDAWLFDAEASGRWRPRTVQDAAQYAARLAAGRRPDEAWMEGYLKKCLELFGRTSIQGKGGIPRLVYGSSWVIPEVDDAAGLIRIVDELIQEP
ncbi:MAG: hypothetical protein IJU63_08655 [Bacteroidales bacterium]|nr:hypothetical protein [Bacteroidales bacterium]